MKLRNKLFSGYFVIVVLSLILCLVALHNYQTIHARFATVAQDVLPCLQATMNTKQLALEMIVESRDYLRTDDEIHVQYAQENMSQLREALRTHVEHDIRAGGQHKDAAEELERRGLHLIDLCNDLIDAYQRGASEEALSQGREDIRLCKDELLEMLDEHLPVHEQELLDAQDAVYRMITSSSRTFSVTSILTLAAGLIIAFLTAKSILNPIHELGTGAEIIGSGDLDHRLNIKTGDEIEQLAAAFNGMADRLADMVNTLEQRVAERTRELSASEERFRDIAESTTDWVWEADSAGRYTYCSESIVDVLGYTPEEVLGKTPFEFMSPDEAARAGQVFAGMAANKQPIVDLENRNSTKDGREVVLLTSGVPVLDSKGNLLGYRGVDKDITERKRMEKKLRESEQRYRQIVEEVIDVVYTINAQGYFTYVNPPAQKLTGYSTDELVGMHFAELIPADWREQITSFYQKQLQERVRETILEFPIITRAKEIKWVEQTESLLTEGDEAAGFQSVVRDVTERKQAALKLQEAERRFRTLLDNVKLIAVGLDQEGNVAYANPYFLNLVGYTLDEILEQSWFQTFVPERDRPAVSTVFSKTLEAGIHPYYENPILTRHGEERLVAWNNTLLFDDDGNPAGTMSIGEDITERKQAEAERAYRLEMERVLSQASSRFVDPQNLDQAINEMLRDTGTVMNANRVYLFKIYDDGVKMDNTHEWVAEGTTPQIESLQGLDTDIFPWWMGKLRDNEIIAASNVSQLPSPEKEILEEQDILSILVIPIFTHGTLHGFLGFDETEQRREWEVKETGFLRSTAQILGRALERAQAEEALHTRARQLATLNAIGHRAAATLDQQELLQAAVNGVARELGYFRVAILLLADDTPGELYVAAANDDFWTVIPDGYRQRVGEGLIGAAAATGETQLANQALSDPRFYQVNQWGSPSSLSVPIKVGGQVIGVLEVEGQVPNAFDQQDVNVLETVAGQLSVAIENARLYEAEQRGREIAEALQETARVIGASLSLDEILPIILDQLAQVLQYDSSTVLLLDEGRFKVTAARGFPDLEATLQLSFSAEEDTLSAAVMRARRPLVIEDAQDDPRWQPGEETAHIHGWIGAPLIVRDRIVGILTVDNRRPGAYSEEDGRLAFTFADQVAVAIENARLFEQVDAARAELQQRADALREANVRLQELDRLKSEFLANMSHELRTPLNSIIGFSEVLIDGLVGEMTPDQNECLENIHSSGHHLLNLINDILDLSKIEAGRMELELMIFDVAELLAEVEMTTAPLIEKKSQVLTIEWPAGLPSLTADRFRIKQVLLNLLSNAHKFTPTEGHITLSCRQADPATMLFSVADTGIGIKPEDQSIIFEEFRQADGSASREMTGTGLGLAISKRIVEMHGGRVWVESEYGHGAIFSFLLPLVGPLVPEPEAAEAREATLPPEGKRVLVVEDDRQFSNLLSFYLRQEGYAPIQHYDGVGVLERVRELKPALITLDIKLPGQDGWSILRALKSDPQTKDIPVLVLSVLEDSELALSLGAVDYLVKPVQWSDLQELLDRLIIPEPVDRKVKVLVVDDDHNLVPLLRAMLRAESCTLLPAYDGQQGLTLARSERPDAILLDLLMPGMSGFEVLETLRADAETADIPVIVLTAIDVTGEQRKSLKDKVQGLMCKSALTPKSLLAELRRLEALASTPGE